MMAESDIAVTNDKTSTCETELTPPAVAVPVILLPPPPAETVPVLQKLSNPPFPRGKFPMLGILASGYDHVLQWAVHTTAAKDLPGSDPLAQ